MEIFPVFLFSCTINAVVCRLCCDVHGSDLVFNGIEICANLNWMMLLLRQEPCPFSWDRSLVPAAGVGGSRGTAPLLCRARGDPYVFWSSALAGVRMGGWCSLTKASRSCLYVFGEKGVSAFCGCCSLGPVPAVCTANSQLVFFKEINIS